MNPVGVIRKWQEHLFETTHQIAAALRSISA
jgi:hypothetical protein